jgi:dTDP-4-dehydrorhamnose reductase
VEANPEAATALNVESTKFLTAECVKRDILLIYISTDYVFPGRPGEAPYKVADKPNPPNAYGKTKYEGEQAVLEVTKEPGKILGVILRVPLLYGHCEENEKSKSAVHPLIDSIYKASQLGSEDPKIKIDDYALRFPTCTEDVGRVLVGISEKYSKQQRDEKLPRVLQFSSEQKYTKWEMTKILADILGLPTDKLEPHDPTKDLAEGATQRPYDSHLDTSILKGLGISVATQDFVGWW